MDRTGKLKKTHIENECTEPNDVMFYVLFIFYTIRIHNLWLKYLHVCLFSVMFLLLNIQWTKSTEKKIGACAHTHTHKIDYTCHLLRMAESRAQGMFVAPSTRTPSLSLPTPCIWTRNSVLMRLADSDSFSFLEPQRASTSSMKMIDGLYSRASLNNVFTNLAKENSCNS